MFIGLIHNHFAHVFLKDECPLMCKVETIQERCSRVIKRYICGATIFVSKTHGY